MNTIATSNQITKTQPAKKVSISAVVCAASVALSAVEATTTPKPKVRVADAFSVGDKVRVVISRKATPYQDPDAAIPFIEKGEVVGITTCGVYVAPDGVRSRKPVLDCSEWFSLHSRHVTIIRRT